MVALGVSAAFFAVEVFWPTRTYRAQELFIAPRICACGLENLHVRTVAAVCDIDQVARHS
jgi:hypothetical protein